jgi:broad specificity phosphatase PhoE
MSEQPSILMCDSATKLERSHRGAIVVCGSHGGVYPAYLAAAAGLRAVILNDAGVGLDQAGIGGLDYCQALGMACATIGHASARIGDAGTCTPGA